MASLRGAERDRPEEAPCLGRIVVRDRGLEVLALRCRLAELSPEPAKQAYSRLVGHT